MLSFFAEAEQCNACHGGDEQAHPWVEQSEGGPAQQDNASLRVTPNHGHRHVRASKSRQHERERQYIRPMTSDREPDRFR